MTSCISSLKLVSSFGVSFFKTIPGSSPALKFPWWPASWTQGYLCLFLWVWKKGVHCTILRSFLQPIIDWKRQETRVKWQWPSSRQCKASECWEKTSIEVQTLLRQHSWSISEETAHVEGAKMSGNSGWIIFGKHCLFALLSLRMRAHPTTWWILKLTNR